jgi:hypothetical protein
MTGAVLLALALGVADVEAVGAQGQGVFGAGAGYIGVGASRIATSELDDRLAARGYPTFGRSAAGINLGAHLIRPGGLTVGAEWHGLIVGDETHQGRDVGIGGGYGTLGLGYVVYRSPRVRIYPRLGLGGGGMGLWIESDSVVEFDDVLADPKPVKRVRQPVMNIVSAVADLGVGAEFLPGGWGGGLMLGVRFGYLAASSSRDWELGDYTVSGGPSANIGGPYIRALIGVGWKR